MTRTFILMLLISLTAITLIVAAQSTSSTAVGEEPPIPPEPMSAVRIAVLAGYYLASSVLALSLAIGLWPESQYLTDKSSVRLFWFRIEMRNEVHLALVVLVMGFLGGTTNDFWWLSYRSAMGEMKARQFITYLGHPWISAGVALIFYGVLRGGLISGPGGTKEVNSYGIAGVSGVVGLFANSVITKLGAVLK